MVKNDEGVIFSIVQEAIDDKVKEKTDAISQEITEKASEMKATNEEETRRKR